MKSLEEAFALVEKHDLKPTVIICSICGCVVNVDNVDTKPCEHLKQLAKDVSLKFIGAWPSG